MRCSWTTRSGESIASFVEAARLGASSLVRPEEARRALETALLIEEAAAPLREVRTGADGALRLGDLTKRLQIGECGGVMSAGAMRSPAARPA